MQELRETAHGEVLTGCLSVDWAFGYSAGRGHPVQRLCLLDKEGSIKFSEVEGADVSNTDIHIPPLPAGDCVLAVAPYITTACEGSPCIALGTLKGSVILLEQPSDRPSSAYTLESWSVSAKAIHAHAPAPLDAVSWSPNGRFLATAAANGSVITWERQRLFRRRQFQVQAEEEGVCEGAFAVGGCGITALCWEADGEGLLLAFGEVLVVARLSQRCIGIQETKKAGNPDEGVDMHKWKAHEGGVTSADWASASARLIVSTGCDYRCCIWSPTGLLVRCIGTEHLRETPRSWLGSKGADTRQLLLLSDLKKKQKYPTAVAWKPSGDLFILALDRMLAVYNTKGELISSLFLSEGETLTNMNTPQHS